MWNTQSFTLEIPTWFPPALILFAAIAEFCFSNSRSSFDFRNFPSFQELILCSGSKSATSCLAEHREKLMSSARFSLTDFGFQAASMCVDQVTKLPLPDSEILLGVQRCFYLAEMFALAPSDVSPKSFLIGRKLVGLLLVSYLVAFCQICRFNRDSLSKLRKKFTGSKIAALVWRFFDTLQLLWLEDPLETQLELMSDHRMNTGSEKSRKFASDPENSERKVKKFEKSDTEGEEISESPKTKQEKLSEESEIGLQKPQSKSMTKSEMMVTCKEAPSPAISPKQESYNSSKSITLLSSSYPCSVQGLSAFLEASDEYPTIYESPSSDGSATMCTDDDALVPEVQPSFDISKESGRAAMRAYVVAKMKRSNNDKPQPMVRYGEVLRSDSHHKRFRRVFVPQRGWVSLRRLEMEEYQDGRNALVRPSP